MRYATRVIFLGPWPRAAGGVAPGAAAGVALRRLAGVRIRATPGLCTGVKWVREFARDSSKLRQGLRGVLWRSSELATVRPRLRAAASRRRWCSGQGVILCDFGSSLAAGVGHGEAHLVVGLGNAGSMAANCSAAQRRPESGQRWRAWLARLGAVRVARAWQKGALGKLL